jgi:hypothetical protein
MSLHHHLHHWWVHTNTSLTASTAIGSTLSLRLGTTPSAQPSLPHRCMVKPPPPPPSTKIFFSAPPPLPRAHSSSAPASMPRCLHHCRVYAGASLTTSTMSSPQRRQQFEVFCSINSLPLSFPLPL